MQEIDVPVLIENEDDLPFYATEGAAGADVYAHLTEAVVIPKGQRALIPTGIRMEIPLGFEIQVRPRSGLALNAGITVLNTPGTIDADYRGELKILLMNHSDKDFVVQPKMKIAQLVLAPVYQARFIIQNQLSTTNRGAGGFGHTGH